MNNKEMVSILFIVVGFIGFFVWYTDGEYTYRGQSSQWAGAYMASEEHGVKTQQITLTYEGDKGAEDMPVSYEVSAKGLNFSGTRRLQNHKILFEFECSHCRVALIAKEIVIDLEWDNKKDTLVLEP
ncbi:hypothetical protein [Halobacillus yeomjeoni]|uniref:Uncharacterized protein n=1 Tax=Halobacillus yeomjeoni TaxID=311194 RepID=A0A931HXL0_9BACI|nr:hypothetical protein [Halobacillus yeomjeoni]MBH0231542.1 hypothetical protein [Halobacillus yeomjeoni]